MSQKQFATCMSMVVNRLRSPMPLPWTGRLLQINIYPDRSESISHTKTRPNCTRSSITCSRWSQLTDLEPGRRNTTPKQYLKNQQFTKRFHRVCHPPSKNCSRFSAMSPIYNIIVIATLHDSGVNTFTVNKYR